ncbi:DUF4270 family protein [Roseivirga misakiensis]|uniref:DUF4270 domain-containing protein n=1 Tax=Roseivirga misakiensis TaxID=1563681 RepID=A0A1E5SXV7_9BACT|nr:DUF4270 family protein [Roseivirga misakiensis]OEK03963.1 hypothetical protein BFP71_10705 [Roseivirga misakiensis]
MDKKTTQLLALISIIFMLSCEEKGEISITDESSFDFFFIDTLSLDMSTIHIDSIVTGDANSLLLGRYENPVLGTINANPFFQLSLGLTPTFDADDTFDSLGIILYPYRNTYGTGETQEVSVFRINESFEPPEDFFYQFDALSLDSQPIAQFVLDKNEDETDSIFIKLPNSLGEEIFQKVIDGDEELQSDDDFREFLGGFAFQVNDNSDFVSTIPFDSANLKMALYYRRPAEDDVQELTYTFPANESAERFNQISGTDPDDLLQEIIDLNEISTSKTADMGFIQGVSSLATKISVPHIAQIEEAFDVFAINNAVLEVTIFDKTANDDTPFPAQLSLHYLSKFENIDQAISSPIEGRTITASLISDDELEQVAKYEFAVGAYVENLINTQGLDEESFYLTIPSTEINTNIRTVAIDATQLETKLKIYISKYND